MTLVSSIASIVFDKPFVTIPPFLDLTQLSITDAAIALISFGMIKVGSTLSAD